jgi:Tfp pilus assembly protein FimV
MEASVYKQKYMSLKQRYQTDLDAAFRIGYEQGAKEAQLEAQMQQMQMQQQQMAAQQQAMAQQQMAAQGGDPSQMSPEDQAMMEAQGAEGGEGQMPPEAAEAMPEEMAQSGELDSKIAELEDLLAKGNKPNILTLRKAVVELSTLRKTQLESLNKKTKKIETKQRSVVKNILKKWQEESKSVTEDLDKILENEGLKLGE